MPRKRSLLPVQVLLFVLATLLGFALENLNNSTGALPWGLEFLRQQSLPLVGSTVLLIIGVMVWQHRTEQRLALPARPVWDSDRSPFPGLEAFTEQDSAVFFGQSSLGTIRCAASPATSRRHSRDTPPPITTCRLLTLRTSFAPRMVARVPRFC